MFYKFTKVFLAYYHPIRVICNLTNRLVCFFGFSESGFSDLEQYF